MRLGGKEQVQWGWEPPRGERPPSALPGGLCSAACSPCHHLCLPVHTPLPEPVAAPYCPMHCRHCCHSLTLRDASFHIPTCRKSDCLSATGTLKSLLARWQLWGSCDSQAIAFDIVVSSLAKVYVGYFKYVVRTLDKKVLDHGLNGRSVFLVIFQIMMPLITVRAI